MRSRAEAKQDMRAKRADEERARTAHARPPRPPLKDIHRARVILVYTEKGTRVHSDGIGWAQIDGPWVLWLDDEFEHWQSWPIQNVITVEWIPNGQ